MSKFSLPSVLYSMFWSLWPPSCYTFRDTLACLTACSPWVLGYNGGYQKSELCLSSLVCLMFWSHLPLSATISSLLNFDSVSEWLRKPDNWGMVSAGHFRDFVGIPSTTTVIESCCFCHSGIPTGTGEFGLGCCISSWSPTSWLSTASNMVADSAWFFRKCLVQFLALWNSKWQNLQCILNIILL